MLAKDTEAWKTSILTNKAVDKVNLAIALAHQLRRLSGNCRQRASRVLTLFGRQRNFRP